MDPFFGMIQAFGFNFAPRGWATCFGQIMSISQNSALFALLGTTYGGDGQVTFGLPDLRGRVMIGMGQGPGLSYYVQGQMSGTENATLIVQNMPSHTHAATVSGSATLKASSSTGVARVPAGRNNVLSASDGSNIYGATAPDTNLNTGNGSAITVTNAVTGGNQAFSIIQPYLAVNISIALEGIFPSRN